MKKISYILFLLLFVMCKSPKVEFKEYEKTVSDASINDYLKQLNAIDDEYSVLMFTSGFNGEKMIVMNGSESIWNDKLTSVQGLGWAKSFRVHNEKTIEITDVNNDYHFVLKPKKGKKFKYIYIQRQSLENVKYVIIYSNSMRSFM
ncbi:hypothetical protein D3C87_157570 [compost metagenome]